MNSQDITVNIDYSKEVNPHFQQVWYSDKPYNILKGGRNSFKSSTIALKLAEMMLHYIAQDKKANIVIIRKVAATIRDSVFLKMQWALEKTGIRSRFDAHVSPYKIVDRYTGSTFYFYGQDDFEKLKSSAIGDLIAVWYEEASEFNDEEEFDQTNITFMRQCHADEDYVTFYWSYNPPRNAFSWINKWAKSKEGLPDYLVHTSTYLDDELGFTTPQMLADVETTKANDYQYYRYLYLGQPVGYGSDVYNYKLFQPIKQLPDNDRIMYLLYGLDTGHQQSATACLCVGVTQHKKLILLDTFYYSPKDKPIKLAPSQQSEKLHEFVTSTSQRYPYPIRKKTIDSAEGAIRNQYYLDYQDRWNPVNKKKKVTMIDFVINLLAQGRVYYLDIPNNQIFITQHRDYRWNEKTIESDNPKVMEEEDHTPDAFQYLVCDNLRELQLIA